MKKFLFISIITAVLLGGCKKEQCRTCWTTYEKIQTPQGEDDWNRALLNGLDMQSEYNRTIRAKDYCEKELPPKYINGAPEYTGVAASAYCRIKQ